MATVLVYVHSIGAKKQSLSFCDRLGVATPFYMSVVYTVLKTHTVQFLGL